MKNHHSLSKTKGLSLIEVLVTITITSIGLMGLVSLQMQAVRATTDSGNRSQAIWVFNDIVNRIHANENSSLSYVSDFSFDRKDFFLPAACRPPVEDITPCSNYRADDNAAVMAAASCTGAEQAAWDLFEVACGAPKSPGFQGDAIRYLPQAQLSIACADPAVCINGSPLTVTLSWVAKAERESITGAARSEFSGVLTLTDIITP